MAEPTSASPDEASRYLRTLAAEQAAVTRAHIDQRTAAPVGTTPVQVPVVLRALHRPWVDDANCRGLPAELFHPPRGSARQAADAKRVCAGCTVRAQCLLFAIETNEEHGIWGGLSERERRRLRSSLPRWARCERCGNRFRKTHGRQRYCPAGECPAATATHQPVRSWAERRRTKRGAA